MIGVLVGACVAGQLADAFGRRHVLFSAYALMQVALLLSSFAHTWEVYAVARFFIGAFFGGMSVTIVRFRLNFSHVIVVSCLERRQ